MTFVLRDLILYVMVEDRGLCSKLMESVKLKDLRFHDLDHEAISRFVEKGLSVAEVALVSGHKDPRMLMRYTHPWFGVDIVVGDPVIHG